MASGVVVSARLSEHGAALVRAAAELDGVTLNYWMTRVLVAAARASLLDRGVTPPSPEPVRVLGEAHNPPLATHA